MAQSNIQGIKGAIDLYFKGMYESDASKIEKSFHPQATIAGIMSDSGKLAEMTRDEFCTFVEKHEPGEKRGEPFDMEIKWIDAKGDVASVGIDDLYLGKRFRDYLLLIKVDGEWRIMNKVWHADPA